MPALETRTEPEALPGPTPDLKPILQLLRDELALQVRHGRLLESQQLALLACDRPRFAALQEEYAGVLVRLEAQDAARKAALRDERGEPLTMSALKERAAPNHRPALEALEADLRRALDGVQALTRRNQTLIQNELNYLAFSLDLIVEAGRKADSGYGGGTGLLLLDRRA